VQAVQLTKYDYRLSNKLETELQRLRCRVNYHALRFTDPILEMGSKLVQRMKMRSKHFITLHLRLVSRKTSIHHIRTCYLIVTHMFKILEVSSPSL